MAFAFLVLVYLAYRFSFTFRSIKARRAGDSDRADDLRAKGTQLFLGTTGAMTLLLLVGAVVLVATH